MDFIPSVFRTGVATNPDTHSARENHAAILRASQEAGYGVVGRATGHDKSWVSRWLNSEGRVSLPELLAWLDQCELRIVRAEAVSETESDYALIDRAERVLRDLQQLEDVASHLADIDGELAQALLALAKRAIIGMQNTPSKDHPSV